MLGNLLFFVPSAWFLVNKETCNYKKVCRILLDVLTISVIWLVAMLIYTKGDLSLRLIIKSLLPTSFQNNWYVTNYILFIIICPFFNILFSKLTHKQYLTLLFATIVFYLVYGFITMKTNNLEILSFICTYIIIYYLRNYQSELVYNTKLNVILLIVSFISFILFNIIVNALSFKINFNAVRWNTTIYNPFLLLMTISLFDLCLKWNFKNKIINYISSLSMLVYLIHENFLAATYLRPRYWIYIHDTYGYNNFIGWLFFGGTFLFISSLIMACIYKMSIERLVYLISDKIYSLLNKLVDIVKNKIVKNEGNS